jgi:hypothetical protein
MALGALVRAYARKIPALPAHAAHRVMSWPPIRSRRDIRYENRLRAHASALPALTGVYARICEGLRRDGIFITSLAELDIPQSSQMLAAAQRLATAYAPEAHKRAAADEKYVMLPAKRVLPYPELFTWGLEDRLLDVAECYLGLPPAYDGMAIVYTVADLANEGTRRWHRDREDRSMVRIAIYLNDVDGEGGPFQFDRCAADRLFPTDPKAVLSCEGPAGTVIFADTGRYLHRGKPAARDRQAIFYSYFSSQPRHPFYCERSGLTRAQIAALTRDLPSRQADSALWHRRLPSLLRMIPSAPV